ncbi:S24 family peptidase [Granulicatella sp. 19428wC4_WM01]|nr:S24 family peptidase [Granulicatella sp. 19428wC4_WM01]
MSNNTNITEYGDIDLYGGISAGTGLDLYDEAIETIRYPKPIPKHDIALRVYGDSMEPMFRDEDIVFIKKTQEIYHGQIGAFIVNGMGFLKKFYQEEDKVRLVSLNRDYKDIIIREYDDVRLVGIIVL